MLIKFKLEFFIQGNFVIICGRFVELNLIMGNARFIV